MNKNDIIYFNRAFYILFGIINVGFGITMNHINSFSIVRFYFLLCVIFSILGILFKWRFV